MLYNLRSLLTFCLATALLYSCKDESEDIYEPMILVRLAVDSNQVRLGNTGDTSVVPTGHGAQNPRFNKIAAHYLELSKYDYTPLGGGAILYHAAETDQGGATAIDFSKSKVVTPGEIFLSIPIKSIPPGAYSWVRLSLSYQNYEVDYYLNSIPTTGTIASFVGYDQYIGVYRVNQLNDTVNANRLQGYWAFESLGRVFSGQSPAGATTVPNPLFATSPIPQGSCVVTGSFATPLVITGDETTDITMTMSLSTNHSFEWLDTDANGKWDVSASGTASSVEPVVDMGLRGLVPSYNR